MQKMKIKVEIVKNDRFMMMMMKLETKKIKEMFLKLRKLTTNS